MAKLYKRNPSFAWSSNLLLFHRLSEAAVRQGPLQLKASNAAAMYEERNKDLWERDVGMDGGELVEWARCRSMNPGRELASVLSRPGPWGLTTNKEARWATQCLQTDKLLTGNRRVRRRVRTRVPSNSGREEIGLLARKLRVTDMPLSCCLP